TSPKEGRFRPFEGASIPLGDRTVPCEGASEKFGDPSRPKEGPQRPFLGRYDPREGRYVPQEGRYDSPAGCRRPRGGRSTFETSSWRFWKMARLLNRHPAETGRRRGMIVSGCNSGRRLPLSLLQSAENEKGALRGAPLVRGEARASVGAGFEGDVELDVLAALHGEVLLRGLVAGPHHGEV